MKDKYYIPDISEIRVGLECEILLPQWSPQEFRQVFIDTTYQLDILNDLIKQGRVRIKSLDKEGIESLGFKVKENSYQEMSADTQYTAYLEEKNGTGCHIEFISYNTGENPDVNEDRLTIWRNNTTRYDFRKYWINEPKYDIVFVGQVKSKPELKKLLEQLGIEYER